MLTDLLKKLDGWKTYGAAVGAAMLAFNAWRNGDTSRAGELLTLALGFLGLRHALAKATEPIDVPPPSA